jgi:hypothetical protein
LSPSAPSTGPSDVLAEKVVTEVIVKGFVDREVAGTLALTERGRAVLRTMLPDL